MTNKTIQIGDICTITTFCEMLYVSLDKTGNMDNINWYSIKNHGYISKNDYIIFFGIENAMVTGWAFDDDPLPTDQFFYKEKNIACFLHDGKKIFFIFNKSDFQNKHFQVFEDF